VNWLLGTARGRRSENERMMILLNKRVEEPAPKIDHRHINADLHSVANTDIKAKDVSSQLHVELLAEIAATSHFKYI
jgi:hypothetical protein